MNDSKFLLPKDCYKMHLTSMGDIHFTEREIDVIACLLNGRRTSAVASLLFISPRTVTTHLQNIMRKLECNSQDGIITFVERSPNFPFLKPHYAGLVIDSAFEKNLKEISRRSKGDLLGNLLIYWENKALKNALLYHLAPHLKKAGIQARVHEITAPLEEKESDQEECLILLCHKDTPQEGKNFLNFKTLQLSEQSSYYLAAFEIIEALSPALKKERIHSLFEKQIGTFQNTLQSREDLNSPGTSQGFAIVTKKITKRNLFLASLCLLSVVVGSSYFFIVTNHPKQERQPQKKEIRSDLLIPNDYILLQRSELLDQMHHQLKNQNGIRTVALIGPGGAGKTTLARQYAHQQQGIVWEINAETEENLKESFWKLANALLETENTRDKLKEIEDISNPSEKEEKLIQLVKENLKAHSHWTLVYDNVERLSDIHKFFPVDFKTWGMGKVIITTRNSQIQNSKLVPSIVQIGELNQDQKLAFFMKIMGENHKSLGKKINIEEINQFLEKIPSYPLDISMTAYYLKTNDITLNEYLELLYEHKSDFVHSQENLLKEAGDYLNTRYGIISLSLKQLVNKHPDYVTPLLLISLLDSQNIPSEFLNTWKNTTDVKNFMYELEKYSLLTHNTFLICPFGSTFSLHRSTQAIILAYFLNILGREGTKTRTQFLANSLEQLAEQELEKENTLHIKALLNHFRVFLSHDQLLSASTKSALTFELGRMYGHLNQYEKAKDLLEQSLQVLTEQNKEKSIKFAQVSAYLGSIYKELSNPQRSQELLEQSLLIYNKNHKENQREIAQTLAYLGNTYRNIGDFTKAKSTLEESVHIYKQQTPIQHSGLAFALINLGATQRDLKNIKDAIHSLEESLSLYREYTPENFMGIARALYYLGSAYYSAGDFKKAQSTLEESINLLKKHSYKNNILTGRIYIYLGNVYRELGEYKKAKDVLEKAFSIHKIHHTKEQFEYVWPLLHIGFVERELGEPQKAKVILEECLEVYKKHFDEKHSNIAWIFAELAKVHNDLHNYDIALKLLEKSIPIHEESYGKDHPTTARALNVLAQTYLLKGDLKSAEPYLQKILTIFQEKKDPDVYKICEDLADLELKKAHNEDSQGNKERAEAHKMQAISYLTQALEVTKATFPESSPHFIRIQAKLKNLK